MKPRTEAMKQEADEYIVQQLEEKRNNQDNNKSSKYFTFSPHNTLNSYFHSYKQLVKQTSFSTLLHRKLNSFIQKFTISTSRSILNAV